MPVGLKQMDFYRRHAFLRYSLSSCWSDTSETALAIITTICQQTEPRSFKMIRHC